MTTFERIMYELASKIVVPKWALLNIRDNPFTVYHQIIRARKKGLLREISCTVSTKEFNSSSGQWTNDCIVITQDGLRYVQEHMSSVIPWASYLKIPKSRISILGTRVTREVTTMRLGKKTAIAVMASSIGSKDRPINFTDYYTSDLCDDDDEDSMLYAELDEFLDSHDSDDGNQMDSYDSDDAQSTDSKSKLPVAGFLIQNAYNEFESVLGQIKYDKLFPPNDDEIIFYDSLSVKRMILKRSQEEGTKVDVNSGRYGGILSSHIRTVLVYMAIPNSPLVWYRRFFEREVFALNVMKRIALDKNQIDRSNSAVLLVFDPESYEQSYNSHIYCMSKSRRHGNKNRIPPCGSSLTHMWVIPYDIHGNAELRKLMTTDYNAERKEIIAKLITTGRFSQNNLINTEIFPLRDISGAFFAIGIHMDMNETRAIETNAENHIDKRFAVGCFEWQVPYYKAVLEDIDIVALDELLPEYNQPWEKMKPELDVERTARQWNSLLGKKVRS